MFKKIKKNSLIAAMGVGMMMFATSSIAQGVPMQKPPQQAQAKDYSDDEIKAFVDGNKVVMAIQEEGRADMMAVVEKQEGIDMETFNAIANAQQDPNASADQYSEAEMAAFEKAAQKLMAEQQKMQQKMAERLPQEADITMEKFQEMMMAYRQDPNFQKEVEAAMEE